MIRSVSHHQESLDKLSIELVTPAGTFTVSGPPHVLRPVATTAELVVAARTAEFTMADRDAPDTALSPAQRSDQDAERGLSQTAR